MCVCVLQGVVTVCGAKYVAQTSYGENMVT